MTVLCSLKHIKIKKINYNISSSKENDRENFEKYSKGRHLTVKCIQITKFCGTVELRKNFEICLKKGVFFIKYLKKVIVMLAK